MKVLLQKLEAVLKADSVLANYFKKPETPEGAPEVPGALIEVKELAGIIKMLESGNTPFLCISRLGEEVRNTSNLDRLTKTLNIQLNFTSKGFDTDRELLFGNTNDFGILAITDEIIRVLFTNPSLEVNNVDSKYTLYPQYTVTEIDVINGYKMNYYIGGRSINISYYKKDIVKHYKDNIGY